MTIATVNALVEELRRLRLLAPAHQERLAQVQQSRFAAPVAFAQFLVQQGWLTPYQVNQVCTGHGGDLVLGPYVLLERIGEGGMGQVFKARQLRLERLVAVKIIRRDRVGHHQAVQRFRREVELASQLTHSNVVLALDAGQVGSTLFYAMEYVEGTDLARMVKDRGPLNVEQSCDFVRQAALGLQYIHEHGLVHRDVKPSNLMVARPQGVVKVLDLGLARLQSPDEPANGAEMLTRAGLVIGTPDFIAPEQALNAHGADIRADLYSLGCTFYHLLTGQVPFPKGDSLEKFFSHRYEEPPCVQKVRPDVPTGVAKIIRRLMAKDPGDRFQTPAELAAALAGGGGGESVNGGATEIQAGSPRRPHRSVGSIPSPPYQHAGRRLGWRRILVAGAAALVVLGALGATWAVALRSTSDVDSSAEPSRSTSSRSSPWLEYRKKSTRLESVLATLAANGYPSFQGKWHYAGPFEVPWGGHPLPSVADIELGKSYTGKDNQVVAWKEFPDFAPGKIVNLRLYPNNDNVSTYLLYEFEAPRPMELRVSLGADDLMMVWLNGEVVASKKAGGKAEPDQVQTFLKLKPGKNKLVARVTNHNGDYAFYLCPLWPESLEAAVGSLLERDFPRKPKPEP